MNHHIFDNDLYHKRREFLVVSHGSGFRIYHHGNCWNSCSRLCFFAFTDCRDPISVNKHGVEKMYFWLGLGYPWIGILMHLIN